MEWPSPVLNPSHEVELLGTVTLGAPAASISFTGIAPAYLFFEVVGCVLKDANAGLLGLQLNADAGANYNRQVIDANGATLEAVRVAGDGWMLLNRLVSGGTVNSDANSLASFVVSISKPVAGERASGVALTSMINTNLCLVQTGHDWNNTAALINRIDVISVTNNLATGSKVSLGGARAA